MSQLASALRALGVVATAIGLLSAVVVLWTLRTRTDRTARTARYEMFGIIALGAVLPARLLLEDRLAVVPWFLLLLGLLGSGIYFLRKAEVPFLGGGIESLRARRALRLTVIAAIAILACVILVSATPTMRARLAIAGIGLIAVLLGLLRPAGLWDAPLLRVFRASFGNAIVTLIYVLVGVGAIIWAFVVPLG